LIERDRQNSLFSTQVQQSQSVSQLAKPHFASVPCHLEENPKINKHDVCEDKAFHACEREETPIALDKFRLPLTRPATTNPPALKILSFSPSRSGL